MKKLQPTTQYKKDLKRYKNNPQKLADLKEVLKMLQNYDKNRDVIELVRLGSHSELFK